MHAKASRSYRTSTCTWSPCARRLHRCRPGQRAQRSRPAVRPCRCPASTTTAPSTRPSTAFRPARSASPRHGSGRAAQHRIPRGRPCAGGRLNNTDPVTKVTILPRGREAAPRLHRRHADLRPLLQSRNQLLDQMAYAMVAAPPRKSSSRPDYRCFERYREGYEHRPYDGDEYGFSDKLGAIKWGSDDDQTTVMDGSQPRNYSHRTAEVIDDEVLKLVETAHRGMDHHQRQPRDS